MYKMCKTEQSAKRQREIEEKLLSLMLTDRYENISVSSLCEEMKMPRKAFYRYFESKDDCLKALVDHSLMEYWDFTEKRQKIAKRDLLSELESFFLFFIEKKRLLDALAKSNLIGILVDTSASSMLSTVNVPKFLPDEEERMRTRIMQFTVCGLMFSMIDWYKQGFNTSTKEMAEAAVRMLSEPLFPNLRDIGLY